MRCTAQGDGPVEVGQSGRYARQTNSSTVQAPQWELLFILGWSELTVSLIVRGLSILLS